MPNLTALIVVATVMFCVLGGVTLLAHIYNLNNIKSKTVGDGQHVSPPRPRSERCIGRCRSHRRNGAGRQERIRCQSCRKGSLSAVRTKAAKLMMPMCIV